MRIFLFCALILGVCAAGQAQVIEAQMVQLGITYGALDYQMSHKVTVSNLDDDESESFPIELDAGTNYVITAVCDGDCGDIDLVLYDDDGNFTIVQDKEADDNPILQYTPRSTAKFMLEIIMADCKIEPCKYSAVIFGK